MQKFKYTAVNLQKQKIKGTFIAKDERIWLPNLQNKACS